MGKECDTIGNSLGNHLGMLWEPFGNILRTRKKKFKNN
jgi:hypothetical protein